MKVILLKDVSKVGRKYDVKVVSDGYGINMLIPQGLAIIATPEALKRVEADKKKLDAERMIQDELMHKNFNSLDGIVLEASGRANDKGHLFAGLHQGDIAVALSKQVHIDIDPSIIDLKQPIKEVGEHMISVKIGTRTGKFKMIVKAVK